MQYPGFIGGSAVTASVFQDGEATINYVVERAQGDGGKGALVLVPTPGFASFGAATIASSGRANFAMQGRAFCVIGPTFYEISSSGVLTSRGTVTVDANPATICSNGEGGNQIFITSGNNGYIFNLNTNAFTQVRTGATTIGVHLDGYFIALDAATSTFYLSHLLDGTTWDPTQFQQRSIQPDPWVSLAVIDRYIVLLGEQTSEIWYNNGGFPFPFIPHPSGLLTFGCTAPFSPKLLNGSLYWMAATAHGQGSIVKLTGFSTAIISTFAVHDAIEDNDVIADAVGDAYEDRGHSFYLLTLPTADLTLCYDATDTQDIPGPMRWTTRATWISEDNRYTAWRPLFHAFAFGMHLFLDRGGPSLYRMTPDSHEDVESRPIRRLRRPPALWNENTLITVAMFELHIEPGTADLSGQGAHPQVMARFSGNGGKTWGPERLRSMGVRAEYRARTRWHLCGRGRQWVPEIATTDPVTAPIVGASVTLRKAA